MNPWTSETQNRRKGSGFRVSALKWSAQEPAAEGASEPRQGECISCVWTRGDVWSCVCMCVCVYVCIRVCIRVCTRVLCLHANPPHFHLLHTGISVLSRARNRSALSKIMYFVSSALHALPLAR
jgi:hypothetical protein